MGHPATPRRREAIRASVKAHRAAKVAAGVCIYDGCWNPARPLRKHCEECARVLAMKAAIYRGALAHR